MLFVIIVIALFVALDVAAMHWGADSRESINSPEWERREHQMGLFVKHHA